jgi:hypothetical protein
MRANWLAIWLLFPAIVFPQTAPPGSDIFESSGEPDATQPVEQAFHKLYSLTAEITDDPSSFYVQVEVDKSNWPAVDQAQAQWDNAMGQSGNALTQAERNNVVPCVAHLNAAIDDMKRGYIIDKTQQTNPSAQSQAQALYGEGRAEFAKCLSNGMLAGNVTETENGGAPGGTNGGTPSGSNGGSPATGGATPGSSGGGVPTNGSRTPGSSSGGVPTNGGGNPGNSVKIPGSTGNADPTLQAVSNFSNQLRGYAETILQNAGRISKAMTDANNVATHNNVGIGVALTSGFGAVAQELGAAARQYQLLAAESGPAAQEGEILQFASTSATESGNMANDAAQLESQMASAGAASSGAAGEGTWYMADAEIIDEAGLPPQNIYPTCTVLSCARLARLLGRNTELMEILEKIKPKIMISPKVEGEIAGGLTPDEVVSALKTIGISAKVEEGLTPMMNTVRAGNPVIANIRTWSNGGGNLHAVVVEAVETRNGVPGLQIYDPAGLVIWQSVEKFGNYFTGIFEMPL